MVQYHKISKTKYKGTGGAKRSRSDKVKAHYGGFFSRTRIEKAEKREAASVKGRGLKVKAKAVSFANVSHGGKISKAKLITVLESPDNRHYARENVVTKGCLVQTEMGSARVTSRPGQHGIVNAILVSAAVPKEVRGEAKQAVPNAEAKPAKA
ncbi:30S ribosomal protein S8e [Candidatus Micrarchaeota archaeon]|nr:30S ribosomal protein S8e [Candidatus Micrarchaeota archaeon]MBI5177592.1 30S ribosomal protein S8e [Candidatus Micrarchaeota archaeon]